MFEYKVVPCPRKGLKAKGIKGAEAQFAHAMQTAMNEQAADGWSYLRSDTWPMDERQGLTGKTTSFQTMMVFQRAVEADVSHEDVALPAGLIEDQSEQTDDARDMPAVDTEAQPDVKVRNDAPRDLSINDPSDDPEDLDDPTKPST